jgi:hypothetical protein
VCGARYLVSRSMTSSASITLRASTKTALSISLLSFVWGPPVGPVPPAPGEEDYRHSSVAAHLLQITRASQQFSSIVKSLRSSPQLHA